MVAVLKELNSTDKRAATIICQITPTVHSACDGNQSQKSIDLRFYS